MHKDAKAFIRRFKEMGNNGLFQDRMTDDTLKARTKVMLFGLAYILIQIEHITIEQMALFKFDVVDGKQSSFIQGLVFYILLYFIIRFVIYMREDLRNDTLISHLNYLKVLDDKKGDLFKVLENATDSKVKETVQSAIGHLDSADVLSKESITKGLVRYYLIDVGPPTIISIISIIVFILDLIERVGIG